MEVGEGVGAGEVEEIVDGVFGEGVVHCFRYWEYLMGLGTVGRTIRNIMMLTEFRGCVVCLEGNLPV